MCMGCRVGLGGVEASLHSTIIESANIILARLNIPKKIIRKKYEWGGFVASLMAKLRKSIKIFQPGY